MIYRRRASPLHAARAAAGLAWCAALGTATLTVHHPVGLAAVGLIVLAGAAAAKVLEPVLRTLLLMAPFAIIIAAVNALVVREGLTVLVRLGEVGPLGQVDVTLEALVYGAMFGLRVAVVIAVAALYSAAVDPDEVLRLMRRVSFRSALAATLATRLMPVLAADARRIGEARRCRPDGGGTGVTARVAVLRAVATGALDRALDVAATLEVRGYGTAGRRGSSGRPWSRHDLAFLASAIVLVVVSVGALLEDVADFRIYPELHGHGIGAVLALVAVLGAAALAPFLQRRGIEP